MTRNDPRLEDFEERFLRWAGRPPATSPDEAARNLEERLEGYPRVARARRRRLAAAASLILALLAGLFLARDGEPPSPASVTARTEPAVLVHPGDSEVVLMWLDETTPLYMTFGSPKEKGNGS